MGPFGTEFGVVERIAQLVNSICTPRDENTRLNVTANVL